MQETQQIAQCCRCSAVIFNVQGDPWNWARAETSAIAFFWCTYEKNELTEKFSIFAYVI